MLNTAMDINKTELASDIFKYRLAYFTAKFDFKNVLAIAEKVKPPERLFITLYTMIENYAKHASFSGYSDDWKWDMKENAQDVILTKAIRYDKFTGKSPFAYITMIIHNVFIAELNRRKLEMKVFDDIKHGVDDMKEYPDEKNYIKPAPQEWDLEKRMEYSKFQHSMNERGVELRLFTDEECMKAFIAHKDIVNKCHSDEEIKKRLTSELNE